MGLRGDEHFAQLNVAIRNWASQKETATHLKGVFSAAFICQGALGYPSIHIHC